MVKGDRSEEKRYEEKGKLWIFNKIADAEMVLSGKVYQLGYSVNYYGYTYCTDNRNHGSDGIPDLQQI